MRLAGVVLCVAGCGRFGFDPQTFDPRTDAAVVAPTARCFDKWVAGPTFSTPQRLTQLATAGDERDPSLTADGLTLYYSGARKILVAMRPDLLSPFGTPVTAPDLSSAMTDYKVTLSADGLEAFESRGNTSSFDIWRASRASTSLPFSAGAFVPELSTADDDYDPQLSADGLHLYEATAPIGGGPQQITMYTRPDRQSPFGPAVSFPELVGSANTGDPVLTADERLLVGGRITSTTASFMFATTRADAGQPFSTPYMLTSLDTPGFDLDPMLSPDACELIFSSNRPGSMGFDLYQTTVL